MNFKPFSSRFHRSDVRVSLPLIPTGTYTSNESDTISHVLYTYTV